MSTQKNKTMETEKKEIELPVSVNVIQPALRRLYNMPGAGMDFKLLLLELKDEVDAKIFKAFAPIREALQKKSLATTEQEMLDAQKNLDQQYKLAEKEKISIVSSKIPKSLLPSENILQQRWNESSPDWQTSMQGDYVTEAVNIYKYLVDPTK